MKINIIDANINYSKIPWGGNLKEERNYSFLTFNVNILCRLIKPVIIDLNIHMINIGQGIIFCFGKYNIYHIVYAA